MMLVPQKHELEEYLSLGSLYLEWNDVEVTKIDL